MKCAFNTASLIMAALLGACAQQMPLLSDSMHLSGSHAAGTLKSDVELDDVPFFSQHEYQCGPAALASVLQYCGALVSVESLVDKVYLPDKRGSLQYELLATVRRFGLIPYVLDGQLTSLLAELSSGRPVLVLQNLGLDSYPVWHYAVVIGFDLQNDHLILRSGTERRKVVSARRFVKSWDKADNWGFVALKPGSFPSEVDRDRYLTAITALEGVVSEATQLIAFRAAVERWPGNAWALTGLANAFYVSGDSIQAEQVFRKLLRIYPEHTIARNNLAQLLHERGCDRAARDEVERALAELDDDDMLHGQVMETMAEIVEKGKVGKAVECVELGF